MNFEILKMGFKAYLEEQGKIDKNNSELGNSDISIFMYANDFKEYLGEKFSGNSTDIKSKSISDIMKMEFTTDGKLVSAEDLAAYDNAIANGGEVGDGEENAGTETPAAVNTETTTTGATGETGTTGEAGAAAQGADMFTNVFNELLQDSTFKGAIDTDGSGDINAEELEGFLNTIKGFDNNEDDVSIDDLLSAATQISDGSFKVPTSEDDFTEKEIEDIKQDMQDTQAASPESIPQMSNVGGSSGGGGGVQGASAAGANSANNSNSAKNLENMTESELNSELTKANNDVSDKQKNLSAILDGSDPEIKGLQDAVDKAYETYQEQLKAVDEEMAKQVDELQQQIDEKQGEIDAKDQEIADKETEISSAENSYNNAKSSRENLESILSQLNSSDSKDDDVSAKINEVQGQITKAKEAEDKAKEAWDKAKDDLDKLKDERKELEEGEGGLNKLNEQMTELEAQIAEKYPEIKEAQDAWDKAKDDLSTGKTEAATKAKSEVSEAQDYVNKVQTALTNLKNKETEGQYVNKYNEAAGKKLADAAQNTRGTVGYCLGGVNDTLEKVYGARLNFNSAYMAADALASDEGLGAHFTEVQVAREDLASLPAGAIVVWNNNANGGGSNVSAAGKVHGHISIALGDGRESSDHIQSQTVNRDATFRVFYPKS